MIKKSQSGVEYLIIIGFVTLAITTVLILAYFYVGISKDKINENQIEALANKIISSSESVFFAGQPSQTTITVFIPSNINSIEIQNTELIITATTSTGTSKRAFPSKVPLQGTIPITEGSKTLLIKALENNVEIS